MSLLDQRPLRLLADAVQKLRTGQFSRQRLGLKLVGALAALALVWFFRPWLHWAVYNMAYSPAGLVVGGGVVVTAAVLYFAPPVSEFDAGDDLQTGSPIAGVGIKLGVLGAVLVALAAVGLGIALVTSPFEERTLSQQAMDDIEIVEDPPQVNADNARVVPRGVADTQTDGSLSYPQHRVGDSDIARAPDGDLTWSYALMPDQFQNQLNGNQIGFIHADMTSMEDRDITAYDTATFEYGQNNRLWNNVNWQLKKSGFWSTYQDDPYEFTYEGEAYMVFPKTGHEWHLSPVPHTTVTWDGVALVHQDGTIEHLSAEAARDRPELDGQRLYPLTNSREIAESLPYRNGILNQVNVIGSFEDVVRPATLPEGLNNEQPFLVDLAGERMSYVYAMEAAGGGTGLSEVWYFDGETGEARVYETGDRTLFGPDRAVGIARGTDTQTQWGPNGQALAVEPVLVTIDNELYWHIKVVTSDQTDVVRNIFVNAQEGSESSAPIAQSTAEVSGLLNGEIAPETLAAGTTGGAGSVENNDERDTDTQVQPPDEDDPETVAYYIVVTNDEGDVIDRIPVEEGQEISITPAEGEESGAETNTTATGDS